VRKKILFYFIGMIEIKNRIFYNQHEVKQLNSLLDRCLLQLDSPTKHQSTTDLKKINQKFSTLQNIKQNVILQFLHHYYAMVIQHDVYQIQPMYQYFPNLIFETATNNNRF